VLKSKKKGGGEKRGKEREGSQRDWSIKGMYMMDGIGGVGWLVMFVQGKGEP